MTDYYFVYNYPYVITADNLDEAYEKLQNGIYDILYERMQEFSDANSGYWKLEREEISDEEKDEEEDEEDL